MMKKAVMMSVILLLCSSVFAIAQEMNTSSSAAPDCNLGCQIWQFLFGSTEARAGKAWFDRSEALVGEAPGKPITLNEVTIGGDSTPAKKCSQGDTESCKQVDSIAAVFAAAASDTIRSPKGSNYRPV